MDAPAPGPQAAVDKTGICLYTFLQSSRANGSIIEERHTSQGIEPSRDTHLDRRNHRRIFAFQKAPASNRVKTRFEPTGGPQAESRPPNRRNPLITGRVSVSKPLRVLIIEDMEKDADLLVRALREGGYEPSSSRVYTREGVRSALLERQWDVVLCDYNMPKFTPMEAMLLLRRLNLDLPFIIVSASVV